VACTVLPTPDGRMKDTGRNILSVREFVVNPVSEQLAQVMNITCIDAPANRWPGWAEDGNSVEVAGNRPDRFAGR
jgi:flavin reductase (DIM6/NTAB) family NADH-FMN oxidoreductase RutF